jgi:hypothetical protein
VLSALARSAQAQTTGLTRYIAVFEQASVYTLKAKLARWALRVGPLTESTMQEFSVLDEDVLKTMGVYDPPKVLPFVERARAQLKQVAFGWVAVGGRWLLIAGVWQDDESLVDEGRHRLVDTESSVGLRALLVLMGCCPLTQLLTRRGECANGGARSSCSRGRGAGSIGGRNRSDKSFVASWQRALSLSWQKSLPGLPRSGPASGCARGTPILVCKLSSEGG